MPDWRVFPWAGFVIFVGVLGGYQYPVWGLGGVVAIAVGAWLAFFYRRRNEKVQGNLTPRHVGYMFLIVGCGTVTGMILRVYTHLM